MRLRRAMYTSSKAADVLYTLPAVSWIYDANPGAGVTMDGSNKVSAMGEFTMATAGYQPTYIANALNGKPGLYFYGSQLKTASKTIAGRIKFSVFIIKGAPHTLNHTISTQDGGNYYQTYVEGLGIASFVISGGGSGGSGVFPSTFAGADVDVPVQLTNKMGGVVSFKVNGVNSGEITMTATPTSTAPVSLGSYGSIGGAGNFYLLRELCGPITMTDAEIEQTELYLRQEYGAY